MDYCDRRIALWQKYKTDLAIRMLPSEVRGRTSSQSDNGRSSMMSSMQNALKPRPRSRVENQSRSRIDSQSRIESSVYPDSHQILECVDANTTPPTPQKTPRDEKTNSYQIPRDNPLLKISRDQLKAPREFAPYRSNKEHRGSINAGGGGLAPILSGTNTRYIVSPRIYGLAYVIRCM